jgi:hypothetical protein
MKTIIMAIAATLAVAGIATMGQPQQAAVAPESCCAMACCTQPKMSCCDTQKSCCSGCDDCECACGCCLEE